MNKILGAKERKRVFQTGQIRHYDPKTGQKTVTDLCTVPQWMKSPMRNKSETRWAWLRLYESHSEEISN